MKVELIKGAVDNSIYNQFNLHKGCDLFNYFCQGVCIEDFLATVNILWPDIIQVGEYVFLADLFEERGEEAVKEVCRLEEQF